MWQSCFADGTRGLTAAARCTRLQPASGCSRERRVRCVSAPETELFSPSYFSLHGTIRTSQLSAYATSVFTMPVLLCCQCIYVRVPRAPGPGSLSSCHCIYGPRHWHSESVTALCPSPSQSRAELHFRSDALLSYYLQSESVTGWANKPTLVCLQSESVTGWAAEPLLCLQSEGLRVRHTGSPSPSPSRAGLHSRC